MEKRDEDEDEQQSFLPDMVDDAIPEIDEAARLYRAKRNQRMKRLVEEIELRDDLHAKMLARGLTIYRRPDITAEIVPGKPKVQVRDTKEPKPAEDE